MTRYLQAAIIAIGLSLSGLAFAQTPNAPGAHPAPAGIATPAPASAATGNPPSRPAASTSNSGFPTEAAAKAACGTDTVVWGNLSSKVLHMVGTRYYGKTSHGAYMCQQQATSAGYRVANNGQ